VFRRPRRANGRVLTPIAAAAIAGLAALAAAWFLLRSGDGPSIVGPVTLQYGTEAPHLGLVVYWTVKEDVSGDFTVAA